MEYLILPLLGLVVGAIGTLVGAGGGFALVPVLLFMYPDEQPEVLTTISLGVVFLNSVSGSVAYARQKRIDYRTAWLFAAATVPGSIVGAYLVRFFPRATFNVVFGLLLVAVAAVIVAQMNPGIRERKTREGEVMRTLRDRFGNTYVWYFRPARGVVLSGVIGLLSSLLGIGGGIIQVPVLVMLLSFPVHIATATSQFMLIIMGLVGVLTHAVAGDFDNAVKRLVLLGAGVVAGAQIGAAIAPRARPIIITRALAASLTLVGIRLLLKGFVG
jgi:uncharacterized protein